VMATVPAVLMMAGTYYMFRKARSFVLGHHTREETFATLRVMVLDIERALTRFSSNDRCSSHETGLLLVLLWRFRCLLRALPPYRIRPFDAVALHSGKPYPWSSVCAVIYFTSHFISFMCVYRFG
jgi:hypothetical protein